MTLREMVGQMVAILDGHGHIQAVVRIDGRTVPVQEVRVSNSLPHPCATCGHTPNDDHTFEVRA